MSWTAEQADRHLDALESVGWRLGLERVRALCAELGDPQERFRSVHVVGSNGKSSVARMTAALLTAHGLRTGCYLSPHLGSWAERVEIDGAALGAERHAQSVQRTAGAARDVERRVGERITQFEQATAAAFLALAEAGVEVACVEAGLGGRLDATNVIAAEVCVLSSIGLEHTEWLGDTEEAICREKLAVLGPGATLVAPARLGAGPAGLVRAAAEGAGGGLRIAGEEPRRPIATGPLRGGFQRRNLALAAEAAEALLGELDPARAARVMDDLRLPGRLELVEDGRGIVLYDGAHNPAGAAALAEALPEVVGERALIGCLAVLEGKDAAGILAALAPVLSGAVVTELRGERGAGRRSVPAPELARVAAREGIGEVELLVPASVAFDSARRRAGQVGATLVAGSLYLLSELWTARPATSSCR